MTTITMEKFKHFIAQCVFTVISCHVCRCARFSIEVLRLKTGAQFGIFDIYSNTTLSGFFTSENNGKEYTQYKSDIINDWEKRNIQKVKISLRRQNQVKAFFEFDGKGTTSMNWMSKQRLVNSSYEDLDKTSMEYCEIRFQENPKVHRMFYIAAQHKGCEGDSGWLVVIPSEDEKPCNIDKVISTAIWYSDRKTKKLFDDLQKADDMTIEVEIDVTCDNSELLVENTTHIMSGLYNETVTYRCLEGFYHMSGDLIRRCTQTGRWSGKRPVCDKCCVCKNIRIHPNDTEAIEVSVKKIKSELSIKANETSKAQRKKISAADNRPSAKAVGSILGGVLLASLVLFIVFSDAAVLLSHIKMAVHNIRQRTYSED